MEPEIYLQSLTGMCGETRGYLTVPMPFDLISSDQVGEP